jgi:hypothetical protein
MLILLSVILSSIAAVTGILAIGSGRHWQFKVSDYFRGKRNAILYLWVTASTTFSILHAGVLTDYGLAYHWGYRAPDSAKWFLLHAAMGVLLTAAHLFVASTLAKEVGPVDKFLWGKRRNATV